MKKPKYPVDGEIFELTLDGDAFSNDPMEMLRRAHYNPEKWTYVGKRVAGIQTRHFTLVSVGYCDTFQVVLSRIKAHGEVPEGQWLEALMESYSSDKGFPVYIPDASWVNPRGHHFFAYVHPFGDPGFYRVDDGSYTECRWLVRVK